MEDHEKIELRSDDVQEILGTPPSWIVRWGTTVILFCVAMLILVSYMVKYPDIIYAPILITTETPPVPVVSRSTGYLQKLMVKEGDSVRAGDLLVVLQNTANYQDVMKLEQNLQRLDSLNPESISRFSVDGSLNLGELQFTYSAFVQILKDYQFKKNENFGAQNIAQYDQQIRNIEKLIRTEKDKMFLVEKNVQLAQKRFDDKRKLYLQGIVSLQELEDAKKDVYRNEQELKNLKSRVEELNGNILQLRKNILDVQQSTKDMNTNKYVSLVESVNQLRSAINKWKVQYLMTAPIEGKISFFNNYWAENQNIKEGDEVMAIVPATGNGLVGIVALPMLGSGKVLPGQRVIIKFESYNFQQYGVVEGVVMSKALLPKDNRSISVRVSMPNGLKTSYGKDLRFDQQMQGGAEIITEERRIIERMFDKLISAYKNH